MNSEGVLENAYQSIVYAAEHGCDVVNCSWGSSYYQKMAQDIINYCVINHDILIVSAAGNTNSELNYYPSSYENVLSVAGTQMDDQKWSPDNSISLKDQHTLLCDVVLQQHTSILRNMEWLP
jgi:subtilisin family serine protease